MHVTSPGPRLTAALCAGGRVVAEPRLAPDGTRVAFVAGAGGGAELVLVDLGGGPESVVSSAPGPRRARTFGGGTFDWLPDGSGLVYAAVDGRLWLQPVSGSPPRPVIDHGPAAAPSVSPDGSRVAYVVDTQHVAVAPLDGSAWPVRLSSSADFCLDPTWSPDGAQVAWHEWDVPAMPWDESRIVARRADAGGEVVVAAGGPGVAVQQPRFSPDGSRLGFLCDAAGWMNVWTASAVFDDHRPLVEEAHEHGGPAWGVGQRSFVWSPDGRSVAYCRNENGLGTLRVVDLATGETREAGRGIHGGLGWAGSTLVAVRSGARTPARVVAYGGDTLDRRRDLAHGPLAGVRAAAVVEPQVVRWPAEDGVEVPGRLYRPDASPLGSPPPLIAWIHGGPTGQLDAAFNPRIAYWVDRGWAVLVPDHRGSTGWGRSFAQALAGRWGELDVSDVIAGMRVAAASGWGDPRRLVVMGASAGGFTVLHVLASAPGLCAAGIDLYGVADLLEQDETTHRFEAHYLESLVGPLPRFAGRYRERSPVNRASAITEPLLILHGADDNVVALGQSRAVAERLQARGIPVELHVYDGEGHGWGRPDTVIDELERTESFLRRRVLRLR